MPATIFYNHPKREISTTSFFEKSIKDYNLALIVTRFIIENRVANFHAIDKTAIGEIHE